MSTRKRARAIVKDAHELGEVCIVAFRELDKLLSTDAVGAPALLLRLTAINWSST